jgi:hypothetical protein
VTAVHEFGLAAAARAIRNGEVSYEAYVGTLLQRARAHADLNAFITIDEASALRRAGTSTCLPVPCDRRALQRPGACTRWITMSIGCKRTMPEPGA